MGYKLKRIMMRPGGVEKQVRPVVPPMPDYLCFTANTAGSTVKLFKYGSPTDTAIETSMDSVTWSDYTFNTNITLSNIGDKVYFRNKSSTSSFSTGSAKCYKFSIRGSISASGDLTSLINKDGTTTIPERCFYNLFDNCKGLTTAPELLATTLSIRSYSTMFAGCTGLTTLPRLPATTLSHSSYSEMFYGCTNIKLSTTQVGDYQTPYRIPTSGNGTTATNSLGDMFRDTGGTFTGTPSINTTYYTSNTVV